MNKTDSQKKFQKRVAIFFAADSGGAQLSMINVACELSRLGKEIDLVMPELKGSYLKQLPPQIKTFDLKTRNPYKLISRLVSYLKESQPAVLISSQQQTNIAALMARWLINFPLPLIIHQNNQLSTLARFDTRLLVRILPLFAKFLYPLADEIVAVSEGVAKDLAQITGLPLEQIRVIYNPIITPQVFDLAEQNPSHPWFIEPQKPIILSAGRLTRQKNYAVLIKAFAEVRKNLDCRLMIIGEGEDRLELEKLITKLKIEDVVSLPGYTDNPYSYIKRASLFVISSDWEGLPFVLVEAMAFGTPVISTDCPSGPSEILANGKYGSLVSVGDSSALSASIQKTLSSPLPPAILKDRAKDFTAKTVGEQFLELLQANLTKKT